MVRSVEAKEAHAAQITSSHPCFCKLRILCGSTLLRFHVRVLPWYIACQSPPLCNAGAVHPMDSHIGSKTTDP